MYSALRIGSGVWRDDNTGPASTPCWRSTLQRLEGAYSDHTLRGYRSDFARFETWCQETGAVALPAAPDTVAGFLASNALTAASATLKRRLCAIRKIHRLLRLPSPVEDEEVTTALRRAMRAKRRRPKQALGLTANLRDQMIAACPDTLRGLRDRAMIAVGYDSLCRRTELVNLLIEDIASLADGGAKLMVRRAKNDPFGDGRWAHISPTALSHLQCWLDEAGLTEGPIFRGVAGRRVCEQPLQSIAVNRTLKLASARAGLSVDIVEALSGHSMRVGAAQDLMSAGRGLLQIMSAGGWTSVNVVGRYVRDADVNVWAADAIGRSWI